MSQATKQVRVVELAAPSPGQDFEPTAFFDADGNPVSVGGGGDGGPVTWETVTGVPGALTAPQAAGTASIRAIGTTATTAAAGDHTHTPAALGAAPASHTHTIANVTGLQAALDGKQASGAYATAAALAALEARIEALESDG